MLKKKEPKVSIIILNWNGKNDTLECLKSVLKIDYPNFEVILIDNGSTDDSVPAVKKEFPRVKVLQNKINLGFTGGNNVGIKYALENKADYMLLLNNDTIIEANLLNELLKPFKENEKIGLTGPKVVYYNEPNRIWCAGCNYNGLIGKGRMYNAPTADAYSNPSYVDWISFCVVLIKKELFEKIGLLDDDYFSSYEDLDFCLKSTKLGFKCYYTPNTIVHHKIARDWKGLTNPLYIYYQTRNNLLCLKKNRKLIPYLISLAYFLGLSVPRRSLSFIYANKGYKTKYILMGVQDFLLNKFGSGSLSNKIKKQLEQAKAVIIGINARYLQRKITGIERYTYELIKYITKIDQTKKFTLFFCNHEPIPDIQLPANTSTYISKSNTKNRTWRIVWEQYLLGNEIKKEGVKLFHGPSFVVPLIKPCKYVVTVHDLSYYTYPESLTWITRLYFNIFLPYSLKKADRIIADSNSTKKDIIRLFNTPEDKIKVIYLGVDKSYKSVRDVKLLKQIKEKYGLPEQFILFVGMISPRKNLLRMLQAFDMLKKKGFQHKFVIVGAKGWLYEAVFTMVERLNLEKEVIFTGYIPDNELRCIYTLADLLLFTTLYEGFGLPILEAMACGCPVVTSTTSSIPEVAGNAALLVDPTDVNDISIAIEKVLNNKKLKQGLIKAGFEWVKRFSWEKTARETLTVYDALLN